MMQLDDVVHVSTRGPRVEEAMYRSIRWLDRCLAANTRMDTQNIFPIIQGGLDLSLRKKCIEGTYWLSMFVEAVLFFISKVLFHSCYLW